MPKRLSWICALSAAVALHAVPALAWGELGHKASAIVAYQRLTPRARARIDQILSQGDVLADPGFIGASVWADRYRFIDRRTAAWHTASFPVAGAGPYDTCPPRAQTRQFLAAKQSISADAGDCIVSSLAALNAQLSGPAPTDARSLRYLIHLVGDLHEPLHVTDNGDMGGACVEVINPKDTADSNLHSFWDSTVVNQLGGSPEEVARRIERDLAPAQAEAWTREMVAAGPNGWVAAIAADSVAVAKTSIYGPLQPIRGCTKRPLPGAYAASAPAIAEQQLAKTGVRLAAILNRLYSR